jgi:hypothetical protein
MAALRTLFAEPGQRFGRGVVTDADVKIPRTYDTSRADRGAELRCDCGTIYLAQLAALYRSPRAEPLGNQPGGPVCGR